MPKTKKEIRKYNFHPYERGTKEKNKIKFKQVSFSKAMRSSYSEAGASTFEGFHSKEVERRSPKETTDYEGRFLTHLATALKSWYHNVHRSSEIEIQIALYDSKKYIISSNDDATAETIYRDLVKTTARKFFKRVAAKGAEGGRNSSAQEAFRTERHSVKMGRALDGKRQGAEPLTRGMTSRDDDDDDIETEGKDVSVSLDVYGPTISSDLYEFLVDDDKLVAFITGLSGIHAEQKIMLALCLTAKDHRDIIDSNIVFAGTFRPCRGCYESLSVVKNFVFSDLQFGVRPGPFWQTTTYAHGQILEACKPFMPSGVGKRFDEGGTMTDLETTTYRPLLRQRDRKSLVESEHFDSESESDME